VTWWVKRYWGSEDGEWVWDYDRDHDLRRDYQTFEEAIARAAEIRLTESRDLRVEVVKVIKRLI